MEPQEDVQQDDNPIDEDWENDPDNGPILDPELPDENEDPGQEDVPGEDPDDGQDKEDQEEENEEEDGEEDEEDPAEDEEPIQFDDIDPESGLWYIEYVQEAAARKLMTGLDDHTFGPNETMTRGMIATVIYRIAGEPEVEYQEHFEDVGEDAYYSLPVTWANDNGIMTGYGGEKEGQFGPDDPITREQFITVLYRYADKSGLNLENEQVLDHYLDKEDISDFALDAVKWGIKAYLMQGAENLSKMLPKNDAKRCEAAKLLVIFDDLLQGREPAVVPGLYMLENGHPVFVNENMELQYGIQSAAGKSYYFDVAKNGWMQVDTLITLSPDQNNGSEKTIYAGLDGSLKTGLQITEKGIYEFADDFTGTYVLNVDTSMMNTHNTFHEDKDVCAKTEAEYKKGPDYTLRYIVVHYTAGVTSKAGSGANVLDYFNSIDSASATFAVDDGKAWKYTDFEAGFRDWHCGDDARSGYGGGTLYKIAGNCNTIGIEVCSSNTTGKMQSANDSSWYFTKEVVENTRILVQALLNRFPELEVIRHYDVSGKVCPGVPGWNDYKGVSDVKWQEFLASLDFPEA